MSKVLRLAASGVASLAGFSVAEVEDIKLAVSEVLITLVEHGSQQPVQIRFVVDVDQFVIEGATSVGPTFDLGHPDLNLSRVVLADICAEHRLDVEGGEAHIFACLRRPFRGV